MRRGSSERKTKERREDEDEVEQMLRAAQDEILLNLSRNSHIARGSPSSTNLRPDPDPGLDLDLDLDLERRFQALKTKSKDEKAVEPDLSTRLAALKAKSHNPVDPTASETLSHYEEGDESEDDEDAQVQKLIEWATDAARLDPSPPSASESDDDGDHHRKSLK